MERPKVVVDASVCAKWYLDEEYSDRARLLRDEFVKGQIAITVPSLFFYETLNALRHSRAFDEKELPVAADSLSKYGFEVWEPRGEVYREAARLSLAQEITVYDAAYVALSEHLRALFYTVDKKLLDRFPRRARHIRIFKEQASS
ncbi:type II toxin-antitoxin system VapC family toxin [Candidatus Bathyarchaeota archaeon]|nr:MAG: type II toxin-antitoxin system VapC family toxin [Candidatus Bathyarchaeota archaeon]